MSIIITPPESAILVSFNGLTIRYYGLIMAVVFLLGVLLSFLFIKKKYNKLEADKIIDYSPFVIFFALIGARLFYVIGMHEFYFKNPLEILLINHGGLSIFGAIVFGIITLYILSKIKKFNFLLKFLSFLWLSYFNIKNSKPSL